MESSLAEPQGPHTPPGKVGRRQQAKQVHAILEEGTLGFLPAVSASKKIPEAVTNYKSKIQVHLPLWERDLR